MFCRRSLPSFARAVASRVVDSSRKLPNKHNVKLLSTVPRHTRTTTGALAAGLFALGGGFVALASTEGYQPGDAYNIPIGEDSPRVIRAFVEVTMGSRMKYEYDKDLGFLVLDRVLHSAVFYPWTYGFVPQTLCGDGDPLDVLIMGDPVAPGAVVEVRPIGYMIMEDEKGLDEKMLAVPAKDPRFTETRTMRDVPEHTLREITHFFETYKALEKKKWVKVGGWKGTEETYDLVERTHQTFMTKKKEEAEARAVQQ